MIVWVEIRSTGKTPHNFIVLNVQIISATYQQRVFRDVLTPWAMEHFGPAGLTPQQGRTHPVYWTMTICKELFLWFWNKTFARRISRISTQLIPLGAKISAILSGTVDTFKTALTGAWNETTVDQGVSIINNICNRLRKCIEALGKKFEHLLLLF